MLYKWNIVGHGQQLADLERQINEGNIHHAYLFSGPKETGKYKVARTFAGILQCKNGYCHTCSDCKAIEKGNHPDLIELRDENSSIKIDEVRDLIRRSNLTAQANYRIILIEGLGRMPMEAQNSFLKTLEEPPGRTIFIMTTANTNKILPTIMSRVRQTEFFSANQKDLKAFLKKKFGENHDYSEVISMAQGRPGLAVKLMEDPEKLNEQRALYRQIENFLKKNDLSQKFSFVEEIEKDSDKLRQFFDAMSRYLRKLIFEYIAQKDHPLKNRFTLKSLVELFEYFEKSRYYIQRNINRRLALENLMIQTEVK